MRQVRAKSRVAEWTNSQRARVLTGMLGAVSNDGYAGATVANVIARAGVSRRTFYEHFTDKDDCLLALYRDLSGRLVEQIADAVNGSPVERAVPVAVGQLIMHAEEKPVQARFLVSDALAGGVSTLHERARTIDEISRRVHTAQTIADARVLAPDLSTQAVIGATQWLIAQRMRRGERHFAQLTDELVQWLTLYERPIGKHLWSTPTAPPLQEPSLQLADLTDELPFPDLSGREARLASDPENRRWRILLACAESAAQSGYAASTVRTVMARARLRNAAFYDHFVNKRHAFEVLHDIAFRRGMGVGAAAYFTGRQWPERVWRCMLAMGRAYAAHPAIAHIGYVEVHELGEPAIQRVEDSRHAFTTLLRADNQHADPLPTAIAAEAIGAAIFEIAHDRVLHKRARDLPHYAYHATYLALAPFLGVQAANRFVQRKRKDAERRAGP